MLKKIGNGGKIMPTYVLKNKETEEQFEVFCQWSDLQKMLEDDKNLTQVITAPKIVSGIGNLHSKVPDGFKDVLSRVKKGSAKGNSIRK
tara:strand:- start:1196 stop:1462 length:267 start_codon:yes stop_codon:yes gene_type:complete